MNPRHRRLLPVFVSLIVLTAKADISGKVVAETDGDTIKVLDANHVQILSGMAWWYQYYAGEQPVEDRERYKAAVNAAKRKSIGL